MFVAFSIYGMVYQCDLHTLERGGRYAYKGNMEEEERGMCISLVNCLHSLVMQWVTSYTAMCIY